MLHLSYVAARDRESGKLFFLAEVCHLHGGGDCAVVGHVAASFREGGEKGDALRTKYSNMLFVIDNQVRENLVFPDPSIEIRRQKELALHHARVAHQEATDRHATAEKAAKDVKKAAAARDSAAQAVSDLEKELNSAAPAAKPPMPRIVVPTIAEVIKAGYGEEAARHIVARQQLMLEAVTANPEISDEDLDKIGREPAQADDGLSAKSDEDLLQLAASLKIEIKPDTDREQLLSGIRTARASKSS